jgi:hypothetical protein
MKITIRNIIIAFIVLGILLVIILVPLYFSDMLNVGEFRLLLDITIPTDKCFPLNKSNSFIELGNKSSNERIESLNKDTYGISNINIIKSPSKDIFGIISITWKDNNAKLRDVVDVVNELYGTKYTYIITENTGVKSRGLAINTSRIQVINKTDITMIPMEKRVQNNILVSKNATDGIFSLNTKIYGSGSRIVPC